MSDSTTRREARRAALRARLDIWADEPINNPTEKRQEAVEKILAAYDQQAVNLDLSGLKLTSLPRSLKQLNLLQELRLNDNQLKAYPKDKPMFRKFSPGFGRKLKLAVAKDPYQALLHQQWKREHNLGIKGLKELPHLQVLDLSNNRGLKKLPSNLSRCRQLKRLNVSHTTVYKLPYRIGQLSHLEELVIDNTPVQFLPEFGGFKRLERFSCANSHLRRLPRTSGYDRKLARLKQLNCAGTPLKRLPVGFGRLSQLEQVDFSNTRLKKLPAGFNQLTALTACRLRNARLKKCNIEHSCLPNLQTLDLRDNQLTKRPTGLKNSGERMQIKLEGNLFPVPKSSSKSRRVPDIPKSICNSLVNHLAVLEEASTGGLQPVAPPPSYAESNPFLSLTDHWLS